MLKLREQKGLIRGKKITLKVVLPEGVDAVDLLPKAVDKGVAFVPGAAFYADQGDPRTMRLSFVTASEELIRIGIQALADAIREAVKG